MLRTTKLTNGGSAAGIVAALLSVAVLSAMPAQAAYLGQIDIEKYWCGPLLRTTPKAFDPSNIYSWYR
jgi:hypothetical protein